MTKANCKVADCPAFAEQKGFCKKHHWRWAKYGDPTKTVRIFGDDEARFWSKVDKNGPIPEHRPELGPCWLWTGAKGPAGYGRFRIGRAPERRRTALAHRWGYETFVGPVPDDLHLDHLCRRPSCVRQDHLEPVTPGENMRRGEAPAARIWRSGACGNGHPMDDAYQLASGARRCRTCELEEQSAARKDPSSHRYRFNRKPQAKFRHLNEDQRADIRVLAAMGAMTQSAIADQFGCSQSTVSAIVNGKRKNANM